MQLRVNSNSSSLLGLVLALVMLVSACGDKLAFEGKVVFTQVPNSTVKAERLNTIENKYAPALKIAMADMSNKLENIEVLSTYFFSARSPEISYDGTMMVFSGQKNDGDTWQIWKMDLATKEVIQVTDSRTNCTDPTWLPKGGFVFSKMMTGEKALKFHALFTIGEDGCCEQRITFQPHHDINTNILNDGRLIFASRQLHPEEGQFKYLALRPDGTKAEVFHLANSENGFLGKPAEDGNGRVLFGEAQILNAVNFNRPLKTIQSGLIQGMINSIFSMDDKNLLISIRKPNELTYGLAVINGENLQQEKFYYNDSEYHLTEAIRVKSRKVPPKLPTRVNPELNSGYVMSMNSDASDIMADGKTAKIRVLGMSNVLGEAPVAEDGSFYLELEADRPFRFQTLDENDEVLRGPSSWMWVRPNERRACVGCHQDREISPDNIVPKAVEKAPFAMIR